MTDHFNEPNNDLELIENEATLTPNNCTKDEIIRNILNRCRIEADNGDLEIPIMRVVERVSNYTGVSIDNVNNIYNNENGTYQTSSIDLTARIEIYKCLRDLYINKIPPTYNNVYRLANKVINLSTLAEFKNNMISMGYNYYNTAAGVEMLLEDPKFTFERYFYLSKMTQIRKEKTQTVYYIDERVIDTRLTFQKPWIDNIDYTSAFWKGYIILHIISEKQFVSSLYCNCVNEQDFRKWIFDIVLRKLNPHSVIVMDNNKLHGTIRQKVLTKYDTKKEMLEWLKTNNIPCTSNMRKAELYQLYRKTPKNDREYDIDNILKANGHDVLRLPTTLHDLSPTTLFWDCIRSSYIDCKDTPIPSITTDALHTVKSRINTFVKKYPEENCIKFEKKIITMERQLYELDRDIENVIDDFIINK